MRFDIICEANAIEHRLTKPNHPWTNGQVERMNRTIKDATVKRYHDDGHEQLRTHLTDFMDACNFARGQRPSTVSRPTHTSAKSGLQSQIDSAEIRAAN
jgi:transposase InsO family protein